MKLIRYKNPEELSALDNWFDNHFPNIVSFRSLLDSERLFGENLHMKYFQDDDNYYLKVPLAGVDKKNIVLELNEDVLTVKASYSEDDTNDKGESQKSFNSISGSVTIPNNVKIEAISAKQENGMLTVTIPKNNDKKSRQISVK